MRPTHKRMNERSTTKDNKKNYNLTLMETWIKLTIKLWDEICAKHGANYIALNISEYLVELKRGKTYTTVHKSKILI